MRTCTNCGGTLTADATYCYTCNTPQPANFDEFETTRQSDTFLKVLCILTIIGAAISLISVPFSMTTTLSVDIPGMDILLYAGIFVAVAKLAGAIFMLRKKISGLYMYTVGNLAGIGTTLYSTFTVTKEVAGDLGVTIGLISLLIPIAFLVMYWLPVNRRLLR